MNKIINWVGGSFFRTIGRLLVYIILGYILALLLSDKNIKLPIFQVLNVNALESNLIPPTTNQFYFNYGTSQATNDGGGYSPSRVIINDYNGDWSICSQKFYAGFNNSYPIISISSDKYFSFSLPSNGLDTGYNYDIIIYAYGSPTNASFDGVYGITRVQNYPYNNNKYSSARGSVNNTKQDFSSCLNPSTYKINIDYDKSFTHLLISFKNNNAFNNNTFLVFGYEIIKNGTITNLNDINSSLTDDSINESGVSDFTNGLNQEYSSLTPFSDFLNLPLTWIQSLFASNQSCTALHLPLPYLNNKYLDLPCMTSFWQQMGAIGTLIQVVWIAIVGVRIFNGLFLLTCETIDPNPDKDMTKLRTWEL